MKFSSRGRNAPALQPDARVLAVCDVDENRLKQALERAGASHVVVYSGNPKRMFLDDNDYPFKANPHFVHWAPLTALPFSYIVYTPGETPVLIYYQPRDYWHVVPGAPDGYWTKYFDIRIINTTDEIAAHLPEDRAKCIAIGEFDDESMAFGIERINPSTAINILHYARGAKTDYELAVMRLAARRGVNGHIAAEAAFRDGLPEFEIHRDYCSAVGHVDAELPYGNIIALNNHGAVLHYTNLDRAALDGRMVDHVPVDVNVGSIAMRRFIEDRQPLLTLHGHMHESARLTGSWRDVIGGTHCFTGAHDGPELALVRFDLDDPGAATRELI